VAALLADHNLTKLSVREG